MILSNTTLKTFFTTQYVDLERRTIDFKAMKKAAMTTSTECLIDIASHLFNVWQFPKFPGEEMFNLDYDNKCYVFLAMMIRHGVHPQDVLAYYQKGKEQK